MTDLRSRPVRVPSGRRRAHAPSAARHCSSQAASGTVRHANWCLRSVLHRLRSTSDPAFRRRPQLWRLPCLTQNWVLACASCTHGLKQKGLPNWFATSLPNTSNFRGGPKTGGSTTWPCCLLPDPRPGPDMNTRVHGLELRGLPCWSAIVRMANKKLLAQMQKTRRSLRSIRVR